MAAPSLIVDVLRHGEPVGGRRIRGQQDDALSESGWAELWAAVGAHCPWQAIVSSPLKRCADFAQALAARHGGLPLRLDERLMEVGFGVWEGRTRAEIEAAGDGLYARFRADPVHHRPAGAEPLPAFVARVAAAWTQCTATATGQLLIVAHAGVVRALLVHVLEIPLTHMYRIEVPGASFTRCSIEPGGTPRLLFHGLPQLPEAAGQT